MSGCVKVFLLAWSAKDDEIDIATAFLVNAYDTCDVQIVNQPTPEGNIGARFQCFPVFLADIAKALNNLRINTCHNRLLRVGSVASASRLDCQ